MAGNLIGEPFKDYVDKQIKVRQKVHGKSSNRTLDEIAYLNSRNAWVKMASGVVLSPTKYKDVTTGIEGLPEVSENDVSDGGILAQKFVLFNGLGQEGNRAGIGTNFTQNSAYGVGGTDFGYSPMPGIVDVSLKCLNRGSIKKITINAIAHNTNQFNVIDALYLRLGYSVFIEWGYDKYLDNTTGELESMNSSLIDTDFFDDAYNDTNYSKWIPKIEDKRKETNGNYEGIFGTISNFSWTFEEDGSYKIKIEVISLGDIVESLKVNLPPVGKIKSKVKGDTRLEKIQKYTDESYNPNQSDFYSLIFPKLKSQLKRFYKEAKDEYGLDQPANQRILLGNKYTIEAKLDTKTNSGGYVQLVHSAGQNGTAYSFNEFVKSIQPESTTFGNINVDLNLTFSSDEENDEDKEIVNNNLEAAIISAIKRGIRSYLYNMENWEDVPFEVYNNGYITQLGFLGANSNGKGGQLRYPYRNYLANAYSPHINNGVGPASNKYYGTGVPQSNLPDDLLGVVAGEEVFNVSNTFGGTKDRTYYFANYGDFQNGSGRKAVKITGANPSTKLEAGNIKGPKNTELSDNRARRGKNYLFGQVFWEEMFTEAGFLSSVFSYFSQNNLAGGADDPRAPEDEVEDEPSTSQELFDQQNVNRINKYFFSIRDTLQKLQDNGENPFDKEITTFSDTGTDSIFGYSFPVNKPEVLDKWDDGVGYPLSTSITDHVNFVHLSNLSPNDLTYYIRLGTLLRFMEKNIIPKVETGKEPLIKIDTTTRTNICYINEQAISTNLKKLIVRNDNFFDGENTGAYFFKGLDKFKKKSNKYYYGRFMNVYFNFERIKEIFKQVDKRGDISLFSVVKMLCDDINECLGNVNNLEPVVKEGNVLRIIDQTPIPGINTIYDSLNVDQPAKLEIFGYNQSTGDPNTYTSNFVNKVGITTEINKKYATMITIGATANGSIPGVEATAFSKWNTGIVDRFKNNIVDALTPSNSYTGIKKLQLQNTNVRAEYAALIQADFFKLGLNLDGSISDDKISTVQSVISNYYKYYQAYVSIKSQQADSSVGFLPFNLKLDMDGLGGIKIYNKILVNTKFLPANYPDTLDFIITGVNHKISNNRWSTHLDTIATNSTTSTNTIKPPKTHIVLDTPPPGKIKAQPAPLSGYTNGEVCAKPGKIHISSYPELTKDNRSKDGMALRTGLIDKWWQANKDIDSRLCGYYTYNAVKYYSEFIQSSGFSLSGANGQVVPERTKANGGFIGNTGNAKQKSLHNKIVALGWTKYHLGESLTKAELISTIEQLYVMPGDVLVYWDNSTKDGGFASYQRFGHICMWGGDPVKVKQGVSSQKWISDNKFFPFCYGNKKGNCWQLYFLRSPNYSGATIKLTS